MLHFEPGEYRDLGGTGIRVSPLGLGTVKFGRNTGVKYPAPFALPDDRTLANLLARAKDLGINLIDTAPAYGDSETRIGQLIRGERHKWIVATKVGEAWRDGESVWDFSRAGTTRSIEHSLAHLQTDYLDIVLVHSDGKDEENIASSDVLNVLTEARARGLVRSFGVSSKTIAGALCALSHCDLVMVSYSRSDPSNQVVLDKARELGKGVLVKKALDSGHTESTNAAITFALAPEAVSSVIIGTINGVHLQHDAEAAKRAIGDGRG